MDQYFGICHTLTLSPNKTKDGIKTMEFYVHKEHHIVIYVHQAGAEFTNIPGAFHSIDLPAEKFKIYAIDYENINLLKYLGNTCEIRPEYKLSECNYKYIHQVSHLIEIIDWSHHYCESASRNFAKKVQVAIKFLEATKVRLGKKSIFRKND